MGTLVELVRRYRDAQDLPEKQDAAVAFVCAVGPVLRAFVLEKLPAAITEDVFQVILDAIAEHLGEVHADTEAALWAWCRRITRNKIADALRRRKTDPLAHVDSEGDQRAIEASAEDDPLATGERLDLEYAMDLLRVAKPPCCDFLKEYFIFDWDYDEVADAHGLTYNAARMQVRRCLELAMSLVEKLR